MIRNLIFAKIMVLDKVPKRERNFVKRKMKNPFYAHVIPGMNAQNDKNE